MPAMVCQQRRHELPALQVPRVRRLPSATTTISIATHEFATTAVFTGGVAATDTDVNTAVAAGDTATRATTDFVTTKCATTITHTFT